MAVNLFDANVIHQFARETRQPIKMRQVIGAVIGHYFCLSHL